MTTKTQGPEATPNWDSLPEQARRIVIEEPFSPEAAAILKGEYRFVLDADGGLMARVRVNRFDPSRAMFCLYPGSDGAVEHVMDAEDMLTLAENLMAVAQIARQHPDATIRQFQRAAKEPSGWSEVQDPIAYIRMLRGDGDIPEEQEHAL